MLEGHVLLTMRGRTRLQVFRRAINNCVAQPNDQLLLCSALLPQLLKNRRETAMQDHLRNLIP